MSGNYKLTERWFSVKKYVLKRMKGGGRKRIFRAEAETDNGKEDV